jgi:CRP-like cAMP-binding protein
MTEGERPAPPSGLVASVSLFVGLTEEDTEVLASALVRVEYPAGTAVVQQGEAGDELFIVEQGQLTVTMEAAGRHIPVARLGPPDVFGEMAVLRSAPRSASVIADTPVVLWSLSREGLEGVLRHDAALAQRFEDQMQRRDLENALKLLQ